MWVGNTAEKTNNRTAIYLKSVQLLINFTAAAIVTIAPYFLRNQSVLVALCVVKVKVSFCHIVSYLYWRGNGCRHQFA